MHWKLQYGVKQVRLKQTFEAVSANVSITQVYQVVANQWTSHRISPLAAKRTQPQTWHNYWQTVDVTTDIGDCLLG